MQCKSCNRPFNQKERLPRMLVTCGHTQCQECISNQIENKKIRCADCGTESEPKQLQDYPKNLILIGCKTDRKEKIENTRMYAQLITNNWKCFARMTKHCCVLIAYS